VGLLGLALSRGYGYGSGYGYAPSDYSYAPYGYGGYSLSTYDIAPSSVPYDYTTPSAPYDYTPPALLESRGYYNPDQGTGDVPDAQGSLPALSDNRAHVRIVVPADAQVWIEGEGTQQQGPERLFISPALQPGQNFTYTIRARWMDNGRPVEEVRTVPVRGNEWSVVDFTRPPSDTATTPTSPPAPRQPAGPPTTRPPASSQPAEEDVPPLP